MCLKFLPTRILRGKEKSGSSGDVMDTEPKKQESEIVPPAITPRGQSLARTNVPHTCGACSTAHGSDAQSIEQAKS